MSSKTSTRSVSAKPMTQTAASRIQAATAKAHGGIVANGTFAVVDFLIRRAAAGAAGNAARAGA